MANYDPAILQKYADELYKRAAMMVLQQAVVYGFVGLIITFVVSVVVLRNQKDAASAAATISLLSVFLFGAIGAAAGRQKAFDIKLEAQKVLLQMQIERNTDAAYSVLARSTKV